MVGRPAGLYIGKEHGNDHAPKGKIRVGMSKEGAEGLDKLVTRLAR